jgi:hypothetical protein
MLAAPVRRNPPNEIRTISIALCSTGASKKPKVPENATVMDNRDFNRAI